LAALAEKSGGSVEFPAQVKKTGSVLIIIQGRAVSLRKWG